MASGAITLAGGGSIPCRLVIDTGVRTTVILNRPFCVDHHLLDATGNLLNATVGGGAGGETRGDIGRIGTLRIGPFTSREPIAIFSRDTVGVFAGREQDGIVGGELLRRSKVTFDYPHQRMILVPRAGAAPPFEYDMSGLFLVAEGEDFRRLVVLSVTRGTPAAEAGLQPRDEIVAIDGRRWPDLGLEQARQMLRTPGARRLEVLRGDERLSVPLAARRLV